LVAGLVGGGGIDGRRRLGRRSRSG
jgi:hypothetical protein